MRMKNTISDLWKILDLVFTIISISDMKVTIQKSVFYTE